MAVALKDFDPGDLDPGDLDPGDLDPGDLDPGDSYPGSLWPGDQRRADLAPGVRGHAGLPRTGERTASRRVVGMRQGAGPRARTDAGAETVHVRRLRSSVYRRRRVLVGMLVVIVVAIMVASATGLAALLTPAGPGSVSSSAASGSGTAALPAAANAPTVVVIPAGGSVWEAVAGTAPAGTSMHEWVARVLELNALDATAVAAGTPVRLPSDAVRR